MSPIRYRRELGPIDATAVFRAWVRREAAKPAYPDANPAEWERNRLVTELETTYEEPVGYATVREPAWTTLVVSGSELGRFDPYPSIGCNWVAGGGTLTGAIDRLQAGELADGPDFVRKIATFRRQYPDHALGAVVVRQFDECWPPVTLDGNHRALAAILAAREGLDVALTLHVAHESPLTALPFEAARPSDEA